MSKALRLEIKTRINYPWLSKTNPKSGKYQVVLTDLDQATTQRLKDWGAHVVAKEGQGNTITVKNARQVEVVDAQGNTVPDSVLSTVGNGTLAIVRMAIIPSKQANPAQCLDGIQILELVEYKPKGKGFEKQEGYVVAAGGNKVADDEEWSDTVDE